MKNTELLLSSCFSLAPPETAGSFFGLTLKV